MLAVERSAPFNEHHFARLSNEVRMAWHRLQSGQAALADCDELVMAVNVIKVLAEGFGPAAVEVTEHAQAALYEVGQRYNRTGRFGVDADTLKYMPDALDFYDECLRNCTPWQMARALETVYARLERIRTQA
jgi:hypothetical protein